MDKLMIDDVSRKAFEKDCDENDVFCARHHKFADQYQLYETQLRWMGFQAAWELLCTKGIDVSLLVEERVKRDSAEEKCLDCGAIMIEVCSGLEDMTTGARTCKAESGDENYQAAMYEISEIVRVARDNPDGLREFLMLNFPKEWGITKMQHKALVSGASATDIEGDQS